MGYDLKGILVFNLKYEHAISFINLVKSITYMPTLERLKAVECLGFATHPPQKIVFQKDAKWCILLHFGYEICSVKSLNIV